MGHVFRALHDTGLVDDTRVLYTRNHGANVVARGLWGRSTFHEESAGVPVIVASPTCRAVASSTRRCRTLTARRPFPIPRERRRASGERDLPGASLFEVASGAKPARPVHLRIPCGCIDRRRLRDPLQGASSTATTSRYWPQLFDLEADPEEPVIRPRSRLCGNTREGRAAVACRTRSRGDGRAAQARGGQVARNLCPDAKKHWGGRSGLHARARHGRGNEPTWAFSERPDAVEPLGTERPVFGQ